LWAKELSLQNAAQVRKIIAERAAAALSRATFAHLEPLLKLKIAYA
jgi:hypothetical protein